MNRSFAFRDAWELGHKVSAPGPVCCSCRVFNEIRRRSPVGPNVEHAVLVSGDDLAVELIVADGGDLRVATLPRVELSEASANMPR